MRGALATAESSAITELRLSERGGTWWIDCQGPLRSGRSIKVDVSSDELVVHTEARRILERWPNVPDGPVLAYTQLEVTAEKLRCIMQRFQCRDLLDLDLLFENGVDRIDAAALFARKAEHKRIDPRTFRAVFENKLARYRKAWNAELSQYLADMPHFDETERRLRRALRQAKLIT